MPDDGQAKPAASTGTGATTRNLAADPDPAAEATAERKRREALEQKLEEKEVLIRKLLLIRKKLELLLLISLRGDLT